MEKGPSDLASRLVLRSARPSTFDRSEERDDKKHGIKWGLFSAAYSISNASLRESTVTDGKAFQAIL